MKRAIVGFFVMQYCLRGEKATFQQRISRADLRFSLPKERFCTLACLLYTKNNVSALQKTAGLV
jgi:hypothetical protein